MLNLTCPVCGRSDPVHEGFLGKKVRCPECRSEFRVTKTELPGLLRSFHARIRGFARDDGITGRRSLRSAPRGGGRRREEAQEGREHGRSGLPIWVHAALAVAGVLSLASVVVLIRGPGGSGSNVSAKPKAGRAAREDPGHRGKEIARSSGPQE